MLFGAARGAAPCTPHPGPAGAGTPPQEASSRVYRVRARSPFHTPRARLRIVRLSPDTFPDPGGARGSSGGESDELPSRGRRVFPAVQLEKKLRMIATDDRMIGCRGSASIAHSKRWSAFLLPPTESHSVPTAKCASLFDRLRTEGPSSFIGRGLASPTMCYPDPIHG